MSTSIDTVLEDHETIREAIRTILKEGDIQTVTEKQIRRQLEKHFQLADKSLDSSNAKGVIKQLLHEEYIKVTQQIQDTKDATQHDNVSSKRRRSNAVISSEEEEDNDDDNDDDANSSANEESADEQPVKKSRKHRATSTSTSSMSSSSTTSTSKRKGTAPTKTSSSLSSSKLSDADSKKISTLKKYILKCGVRKQWAKELSDCKTGKSQIARLQTILKDLGVEGRPTLEKCNMVAMRRELNAEQEALNLGNIMDTKTRKSRKRQSTPDTSTLDTTTTAAETISEAIDFTALGDPDSDFE
ncbi:hypothetical protein BDF22DRAFT_776602 [Syncephalis plumigaleata]|nr:hypothetical protein BDF22DRAFT_776602 [Syncephalis plumigaleata]